jgi:nucleoside-triphosphatase THEP1/SAM-dependent methyltransferase
MSSNRDPVRGDGIDFGELYRRRMRQADRPARTPAEWDARAAALSRSAFDSEYVHAFVARMNLEGCATLLDVGCGPGTVALSAAPRLQHVYGLDFSPVMLDQFVEHARARGVAHATPILRGWDDDWADVPPCDLVVASRSTAVGDLEAAVLKLVAKTRIRAYVSYPADGHFVPDDVLRAIGRTGQDLPDYLWLLGILRNLDLYPTLDYLPGRSRLAGCGSFDEVLAKVEEFLGELTPDEATRLRRHYDACGGRVGQVPTRWALVSWEARGGGPAARVGGPADGSSLCSAVAPATEPRAEAPRREAPSPGPPGAAAGTTESRGLPSSGVALVWRRAAVYGSLWAAVEIVVGSFLHNLRVPFAGSALSAVGVVLMTAGHRASPERGLIWRSALVCALMKSVSPSAVILGPMIGIFMEGVLLEGMVRLSRGRAIGYVAGGALAVSWSMVQRLANALIAFGPDVVKLYADAYRYAARSLGVSSFGPFDLIATLVGLELAAGCAAAIAGLRVAGVRPGAAPAPSVAPARSAWFPGPPTVADGNWSLPRLAIVTAALVAGMAALGSLPLWAAAACVAAFGALVLRSYPRAAARVRRPSLWIELGAVTLAAGLVFGGITSGAPGLITGAAAGLGMALRATMVVLGFTAISVELRNPAILARLERRRLRGLSDALGVAFGALPTFMAALSEHRGLWTQPRRLGAVLLRAADQLAAAPGSGSRSRVTAIVTGATGSGKTTLVGAVVERLQARGLRVAGIVAPGLLADGRRAGFDIVNLATGERTALAREGQAQPGQHARWSRFAFDSGGLALGRRALGVDAAGADVVVVDEVGPFELSGGGWATALDALRDFEGATILVVRDSLVDEVRARWGSANTAVHDVAANPDHIADQLA